jgi:beta-galactosidase
MQSRTNHDMFPPLLPHYPHLLHGADYNPEQWLHQPEILARDMELMKKAQVTSLSIGIFSWTSYEPSEGVYTFDWLDVVMDTLAKNGLFAFLATPSAAKPTWLSEKYPEIRRVREDGTRELSGSRHNHCPSSPIYREKLFALNSRLAERYKNHPALALWHINNEVGGDCLCELCMERFHSWLKDKYGDLDTLNRLWWSRFWNHTFTEWSQIRPHDYGMDSMILDRRRFANELHVDFLRQEIAAVKHHTPHIPCTTNFMGSIESLDYWQWAPALDIIANDSYPAYDSRANTWQRAADSSFNFDMMRSFKGGKPWLLMESTPSSVNWHRVNKLKRPGVHKMEMVQALAHGAEGFHYFQWRKGRAGFEKYHGAVVDHAGHEHTRVFGEVAQFGSMLRGLDALIGSTVKAEAALLFDPQVGWSVMDSAGIKRNAHSEPYSDNTYARFCKDHYRGLWRQGISIDTINSAQDFSRYKLLVAPALHMLLPGVAGRLKQFVAEGGTLLCTCLSGWVNEHNSTLLGGWPGDGLMELFGLWDEETDYLYEDDSNALCCESANALGIEGSFALGDICAVIHPTTATVLARYSQDYYATTPVLTVNQYGKGKAYYLAAKAGDDFLEQLYGAIVAQAGVSPLMESKLPPGVGVCKRSNGTQDFYFFINYDREARSLNLGSARFRDMENGALLSGTLELAPYQAVCTVAEAAAD